MATDIEKVRLMLGDVSGLFSEDDDIQTFIDIEKIGSVVQLKSAAALAYESAAGSKALVEALKILLNFTGDNKGMVQNLLAIAKRMRETEDTAPYSVDVEQSSTPFSVLAILHARRQEAGFGN